MKKWGKEEGKDGEEEDMWGSMNGRKRKKMMWLNKRKEWRKMSCSTRGT